jgi:hypothetical protein
VEADLLVIKHVPARRMIPGLRGEFEGGAEVVLAEVAGDAVEVAFAVENDAVEWRDASAGFVQVVKGAVFPCAVRLRGEFKNDAAPYPAQLFLPPCAVP